MRHKTDRTKPMTLCDESILKHISLDTSLEPILFCKNTSVIKKNGKHRPRAVVCTELYLYIYKKKKLSKSLILSNQLAISNITTMNSTGPGEFQLKLKNEPIEELSIRDNNAVAMAKLLATHFIDVFRETERPRLNVIRQIGDNLVPSQNAFVKCVKFQSHVKKLPLSPTFTASLDYVISRALIHEAMGTGVSLDLGEIEGAASHQDLLFYGLCKCEYITRLLVPDWSSSGKSSWDGVGKFVSQSKTLKELETREPINASFKVFLSDARGNINSSLTSVVFSGSKYDESAMEEILTLVSECPKITTLRFDCALPSESVAVLSRQVEKLNHLRALELVNVPSLQIQSFDCLAVTVQCLKVANCGLDLTQIFELLQVTGVKLTEIDASGNRAHQKLNRETKLPPTLSSVIMRDIEWENGNLITFLEILEGHRGKGMKLDISKAHMSDEDWTEFETFMASHGFPKLTQFVYDENRMSPAIVEFMGRCPVLNCIRMRGSFGVSDDWITDFCSYIRKNRTLKELHINGTEKNRLGLGIKHILNAVKSSRLLQVLDISDQGIGVELLPMLADFFTANESVNELMIDGNNLLDLHGLERFVAKLKFRNFRVVLRIPTHDLFALAELGNLTPTMVKEITTDINELQECMNAQRRSFDDVDTGETETDSLSAMKGLYVDDRQWQRSLNYVRFGRQTFHYDRLNQKFGLKALVNKVRSK